MEEPCCDEVEDKPANLELPVLTTAPDQKQLHSSLKFKCYLPAPTHWTLQPICETDDDEEVEPELPFEPLLPQHKEITNNPLEYMEWEKDVVWDYDSPSPETERWLNYCLPSPITKCSQIDWDDSCIVWDATKPTVLPIVELHLDRCLPNMNWASKKEMSPPQQSPIWCSNPATTGGIQIRKRPSTSLTCHSAVALSLTLLPWQMSDSEARQFHRPLHSLLGSFSLNYRPEGQQGRHLVFGIRNAADLSASDHIVILLEYSEQNPPMLQNAGMSSKLRNYYSQVSAEDQQVDLPPDQIGENNSLRPDDASPFLGRIPPGQRMYGLENHLFKAVLFPHKVSSTDFLLVETLSGRWVIREIPYLFLVGQLLPLEKVPSPSSNMASTYSRNRLISFVTQLLKSKARVLLSEIKEQFPNETEPAIRKVLKAYCEFKRSGEHGQCWVLKANAPILSEAMLRATPEQVCLNESSQAHLVRLKDIGVQRFNNSYALTEAQELLHGTHNEGLKAIEAEVQLMPWNASSSFCDVMRGRLKHSIVNAESAVNDQFAFAKSRTDNRIVKDTREVEKLDRREDGSDLRTVLIKDAKAFLVDKAGLPKEQVAKLRRWPLIDLVREKATEMAQGGSTDPDVLRYSRRVMPNTDTRQNEFKERAQRIFDRMVSFCSGADAGQDDDIDRFEQELMDLIDEAAEDEEEKEEIEQAPTKGKRKSAGAEAGATAKKQKLKPKAKAAGAKAKGVRAKARGKAATVSEPTPEEEASLAAELRSNLQRGPIEDIGREVGILKQTKFFKILRKVSTVFNADGSRTQKTEYVRDPVTIDYLLKKKRNLEQKRSNIASLLLMMDDQQGDPFWTQLLTHCRDELNKLRTNEFPKLSKPRQGTLVLSPVNPLCPLPSSDAHSPNVEKAKVRNSLWYSTRLLEGDDLPVVRCGEHAPLYRSYAWRKNSYTRLDPEELLILTKLTPSVFQTSCQHRDPVTGIVCGRNYVPVGSLINQRFLRELDRVAEDVSYKIVSGFFLPVDYAKKMFEQEV